ncbi:hypothetical protein [Agrobacterium radiobacter]|uniref:hypothetical protein n=1 Tax=Agrobacterium radiobacter TaxID=362 RepID=UPI001605C4FB|nr:hypothetical protein [Agrobacterium radiobacter]MBB4406065.1 hypothetical protein [Agrobacterium radiobacter]MBB4450527.1 hypothetical protein [Agrobacterium radiobacter]
MNFENVLAYVRPDYQAGSTVYGLLFPECEIQITKTDAERGTVTTTIKGARAGDTMRGRISSFIDLARRDKASVLIATDDASQTGFMRKLMLQAMPEMQALAGHSSFHITMSRYGHLFPSEDHASIMDKVDL